MLQVQQRLFTVKLGASHCVILDTHCQTVSVDPNCLTRILWDRVPKFSTKTKKCSNIYGTGTFLR